MVLASSAGGRFLLDLRPASYRVLLLASAAGVALTGAAGVHAQTGPGPVVTVGSGQSLNNTSVISATSGAAVRATAGVGSVTNNGLIEATGANGVGIQVTSGGSVGSITNSGTVQATSNGGNAMVVGDTDGPPGTVGTIANTGLILSSGANAAILVEPGSSITAIINSAGGIIQSTGSNNAIRDLGMIGAINNAGTIETSANSVSAITVFGTLGTLTNSGMIQATGTSADAVHIETGGSTGSIVNNAGGLIQAGTNAVAVLIDGTVGTITNGSGGTIQAVGSHSSAVKVNADGSVAAIINSAGGTIQSGGVPGSDDSGIHVAGSAGLISNAGLVQIADGPAMFIDGGAAGTIASVGTVLNSGTIQALNTGNGILVGGSAAATVGTIINSGSILSAGTNSAISVQTFGSVGTITNNAGGTLLATGIGHGIFVGGTIGSINNGGQIIAPQSSAIDIAVGNTSTVPGIVLNGITNTATGLIQGGPSNGSGVAIDDSAGASKLTITNAGTIIGAVNLGPAGDTLNVTGGNITGNIVGMTGSADVVNFSPGGTFTTAGSIINVDTINVASGTLALQDPAASTYGASAFNIAAGAATDMNAGIQAANVNNAGLLNVGSGSQSVTGNYTQAMTGSLGVTVNGTGAANAGKLTVSGTATIQGGANAVSVHVPASVDPFGLLNKSWHVLTSGSLIANATALTASSDNAGIGFGLTDSATDVILSVLAQTPGQIVAAAGNDVNTIFAPFPNPNHSQEQARLFLQSAFVGLASSGRTALAHQLDTVLVNLTPAQVGQLNNQLLPSGHSSAALNLFTTTNVLGAGDFTIFGRLTSARLDMEQTGLAAGDPAGRGFTFWGQPFGAITSQGARDGFDGYDAGTYGITLGADTLVTSRLRAGVAVTLSNSNVNFNGTLSGNNGSIFTGELGVYGTYYLPDNFFLDGLLAFAYNHYNQRNLTSALGLTMDADYGGLQFGAKLGAGYDYKLSNGAVITPYASVQQYRINFNSYNTTGGSSYGMDMHVDSNSADITQTRLGARVGEPIRLSNGALITPEVHAYWLHDFGTNELTTTYTTADFFSPNTFTMIGPAMARDTANIGLGLTFKQTSGWSLSGGYDFLGASGSTTHNFYVLLKIDF